ncbi:MAG: peptidyl-prolyl cis-trans isomerase [Proteobacteria bacterium]|nr:peptidyl-prolyl cis-trans isomerase [Pseudomonadota bacterium]
MGAVIGISKKLVTLWTAFSLTIVGCGLFDSTQEGVALTVGKRVITPDKLERELRRMTFGVEVAGKGAGEMVRPLINQMVDYYLILEYGSDRGIVVSDDELHAAIREIKKDYSDKDFHETLLQGYIDFDEWKEGLRERLLMQKIIKRVTEGVPPVPFQEIKAYYDSHRDDFRHPEMVKFRQILRSNRQEIQRLLNRLKGIEEQGAAGAGSSRKDVMEGFGDAVWVAKGDLEESMEKVIFSLSVGGMSDVVETPYGFHIIQMTARRPEGVKSLPEAIPEIEASLSFEKREAFYQRWLDGLRGSIPVQINHKLLERMELG